MTEREIFIAAIQLDNPDDRLAHIRQACGTDEALRQRVEHLLKTYEQAGSYLEAPTPVMAATIAQPEVIEQPGTVIGPYKLLQQIGEGGMGTVFMADQEQPVKRRVALKIIKPGMDSRQVIARFEAERQALALMDHPNIAKVLDAGTTGESEPRTQRSGVSGDAADDGPLTPLRCVRGSGRPFFVMELVKGIPITKYCDDNHLTPRERLELFIPVCHAVQHAHQKGIIHRDIKPSNVLVALYDGRPVPKVIDFGVAKATSQKLTERTMFTQFGQIVGTLEYMSPEQADLNQLDIDTRSDIYSLGVLLYELLTGTTPFERKRLREAAFDELLRIIREEEPPKPSTRLSTTDELPSIAANRKTEPRKLSGLVRGELDWIVMKALEKDRNRRYETANGLAMDIQRYLADEPVLATPPSTTYRFRKFARRNRIPLAMGGMALLIILSLAGSVGWFAGDRAARWKAVERQVALALQEATELMQQLKWLEARAWLERADGLLAGGGSRDEVRKRVSALQNDLDLVQRLEEVRLERVDVDDGGMTYAEVDARYAQVFRDFQIDLNERRVDEVVERIAKSAACSELTAMLDDWAIVRRWAHGSDDTRWKLLLGIARAADSNELRNRMRFALESEDQGVFRELATSNEIAMQPPSTIVLLASALAGSGDNKVAVSVLRTANRIHPGDFWINYALSSEHHDGEESPHRLNEIVQFSRVAFALRPQSAAAESLLGDTLRHNGALDESIAVLRRAIHRKPDSPVSHNRLGLALAEVGAWEEAIAAYREAIRLKPDFAGLHHNLGMALHHTGALDAAVTEMHEVLRLKPNEYRAHNVLGLILTDTGHLDEALAELREAIRLNPGYHFAHYNLGRALSGIPGALDEAVAAYCEAIRLKPDSPEAHCNLGIALRRQGRLEEAIAEYQKAIELKPDLPEALFGLGLAYELFGGEFAEAIVYFRRGHDLRIDSWMSTFSERIKDCERMLMLEARLPHVLAGEQQIANARERIHYGDLCYRKRRFVQAASFFAEAQAQEPDVANDWMSGIRYNAACAAALAGSGQGEDAGSIGDEERARLRQQALDWLRADLESWRKLLEGDSADARATVVATLKHWQTDTDLAGVRDPEPIAKLPEAEREAWGKLWEEVAELLKEGSRE